MARSAEDAIRALFLDEAPDVQNILVGIGANVSLSPQCDSLSARSFITAEQFIQSAQGRETLWHFLCLHYTEDFLTSVASATYAAAHDDIPISMYNAASTCADATNARAMKTVAYRTLLTQTPASISTIPDAWFHADKVAESARAAMQLSLLQRFLLDPDFTVPEINPADIVPAMLLIIAKIVTSKSAAQAKCAKLYYNTAFLRNLAAPFSESADAHTSAYLSRIFDLFHEPGSLQWFFAKCPTIVTTIAREDLITTMTVLTLRVDQPVVGKLFHVDKLAASARAREFSPQMTKIICAWLNIKAPPTLKHKRPLEEDTEDEAEVHTDGEDSIAMKDAFCVAEEEDEDESESDEADDVDSE